MRLYITGYERMPVSANGHTVQIPHLPSLFEWYIDIPIAQPRYSPVFPPEVRWIEVTATGDCWLDVREAPKPEVGKHPVFAGERRSYGVFPGHMLGVIGGDHG